MRKDKLIWGICILLFLAGGVFFNIFPSPESGEGLKIVDWFAVLSSSATAVAAIAAWQAASVAQRQAFDSSRSIRWQMHKMHQESFDEWLDGIETDLGVKFSRRHELYDVIFPFNRDPAKDFIEKGSQKILEWHASFDSLVEVFCRRTLPGQLELETWAVDYVWLAGDLNYICFPPENRQLYIGGSIPSGLCLENYELVLPVMGQVLLRLSNFAFYQKYPQAIDMTKEFEWGFKKFIDEVRTEEWHQHQYK
ncbi:hypothetical protein [Pseudomonas sp. R5(2019)]|uniref:hypothetical protein n=1 Tax=Pseudomonas sp. R5(2019) TaxID=2697566 RepID=UPI001413431C|nr:hypothetical protein [Pseudomonas sp. R5(2019)]NBA95544.1 hypothetical protein [Pseudomonas sp. R5(2019)]